MVEQSNAFYNAGENNGQIEKIERFYPEAKSALEQQRGYKIYALTGKTMLQLSHEGVPISKEWRSFRDIDDEIGRLQSRRSEVAIEDIGPLSKNRTLIRSFNKSVLEQVGVVRYASHQLQQDIPGAKMIIGNPVDYLELAWEIYKITGRNLFESEFLLPVLSKIIKRSFKQNWFARTDTPLRSVRGNFAFAVSWYQEAFHITAWPRQAGNHIMGVLPLVVPAEQKPQE